MALASGTALWTSARSTPVYEATASVFIGPSTVSRSSATSELGVYAISSRDYIASFAQQLRGRQMAEQTVEALGLEMLPTELASRVSTQILTDTRIIQVTFSDTDPERAAHVANGVVNTFAATQRRQGTVEGLQATTFQEALVPNGPVAPRPIRDGVIGLFLGALVGVGGAVGMEQMDTRLRNRGELEMAIGPVKVLGEIPAGPKSDGRKLWIRAEPGSLGAEAFRILRTNLQFLAVERRLKSFLVTSPSPQEGKTTVSANLAASLAAGGYRTLLVDADMRHPTIHEYFGISHLNGLADILAGTLTIKNAIQETDVHNLYVIPAGPQPPNPSELFGSLRMSALVDELQQDFDLVVFDAPPALLVADAPALSSHLDGVVFVTRAGATTRDQAREALRRFTLLDARILGAILNGSKHIRTERYYGYAYRNYYRSDSALENADTTGLEPAMPRAPRRQDDHGGTRSIDEILAELKHLTSSRLRSAGPPPSGNGAVASPSQRNLPSHLEVNAQPPAEAAPAAHGPGNGSVPDRTVAEPERDDAYETYDPNILPAWPEGREGDR